MATADMKHYVKVFLLISTFVLTVLVLAFFG